MANEDALDALLDRYVEAFGEAPLEAMGLSDEGLAELIRQALERGEPIPEDAYFQDVPPDALA